jgi:bifunctional DNase/RNase
MAVRMELSRLLIRELTDMQIIELREVLPAEATPADAAKEGDHAQPPGRTFPIVIGLPEALAIDRRLKGLPITRPQSHDLMASIIDAMGGRLESIIINDLSGGTFFATLKIRQGEKDLAVDARPSDAIALGVATNVPIFVAEHVLSAAAAEEA